MFLCVSVIFCVVEQAMSRPFERTGTGRAHWNDGMMMGMMAF